MVPLMNKNERQKKFISIYFKTFLLFLLFDFYIFFNTKKSSNKSIKILIDNNHSNKSINHNVINITNTTNAINTINANNVINTTNANNTTDIILNIFKELSQFKSYSEYLEDLFLFIPLKDIKNGFYIDIGAYDPNFVSVTKAFYLRGWHRINIEPLPYKIELFNRDRPKDINLQLLWVKSKEM